MPVQPWSLAIIIAIGKLVDWIIHYFPNSARSKTEHVKVTNMPRWCHRWAQLIS